MIPPKLSHYRVLEKIGAGGMGVVYRAHDVQLDRDVALKVLPSGLLADENARRRFRKEALALAKLNHPNIGGVYEFGNQDEFDFLVMELVSGVTLDAKVAAGPLRQEQVLRLGMQLADGLEAAHAQGIVHRDLKPGNLRLTSDGRLKILDFGLAEWAPPQDEDALTVTITKDRQVSGTVPYIAPEQLRGQKCDARTDVYSAGVVLYELATGKRPFAESSGPQLIGAILERPPSPPNSHNRNVSPALQTILLKALDKDPDRRYQSAKELRVDLERVSSGVAPVHLHRRRWTLGSAGVVLAALAVLFAWNVGGWRTRGLRKPPAISATAINARRSVAVLGFKNLSGKPEKTWISTALAEMLTTELAAGEQLRTIPGENVARMKQDLSLADADSFGQDTLARIRHHLGSDVVVLGSYLALGNESGGKIRLDFHLQDTEAGETIASVSETGSENELLDLVARGGSELRQKLGIGQVSAADNSGVRASLPTNTEAAILYSEGLAKLREFEALQARDLLEKAVAADPGHAPTRAALASAWSALGYDGKAREQAKQAFDLSANLSREERLFVEARYRELGHEWPKAVEIYRTLTGFFPDNLDYGLKLVASQVASASGKDALLTLDALRRLPPPANEDARIDLAESRAAASQSDFKRAQQAAARAGVKGRAQGAHLLVAQARSAEGWALERLGQTSESAAAFAEAESLFTAAGDKVGAAQTVQLSGNLLYDKGDFAGARKAYEDSLVVFRQLGNQLRSASSMNNLGNVYYEQGDLAHAKQYYEQTIAAYREIDDRAGLAGGLGNLANVLDAMGELNEALKMQASGLQVFRDVGDQRGTASTLANLGNLLAEMGDLDGAQARYQEAFQIHQQIGHKRGAAYALYGLADVLTSRGNFSEARKKAEASSAIRQELGEQINVAASQAQLAYLAMLEGTYGQAENLARAAATEFDKDKVAESGASAYALLTLILLRENKLTEAQTSAARAVTLSQQSESRPPRFEAELANARVRAAGGKSSDALRELNAMLPETKKYGYLGYEFETRLALGEIEIKTDKTSAGRARLWILEKDARGKGFARVADAAAKLIG